jgi:hypothetical protein
MSDTTALLAVFDEIESTTRGIDKLHEMGLKHGEMNVISGLPIPGRVLGRPSALTNVSRIAGVGALLGMCFGLFLVYGTPYLYPLHVGGQPVFPVPMGFIITFEMTMLGLMGFAFLGLFVDSGFPAYTPMQYLPEISDGKIAILFHCPDGEQNKFVEALKKLGAESVTPAEARQL